MYGRCANCFDSMDLVVGMLRFFGGLMTNQEVAKKDSRWCLNGGLIYRRIALASETPSNIFFAGRMSFSNIFFEPLP